MFNSILNQLKRYNQGVSMSVQIPLDEDGFVDRECPSEICKAGFKVLFIDWKDKVANEQVFCPQCRFEAPASEWNTPVQVEYLKSVALAHIAAELHAAMAQDAQSFNRQPQSGFIRLTLSFKPGVLPTILPIEAAAEMQQKFQCESCGCQYASIGAAYFCPACGHNSAVSSFDQTINIVRTLVSKSSEVRATLTDAFGADVAENSVRNTLEDSVVRLVGGFQKVSEALFDQDPARATMPRRKNLFQNLAESSRLWQDATGVSFQSILSANEYLDLGRYFQQRHLIAHCNGIVDQEYLDKSQDRAYRVGQRLVLHDVDILSMADVLSKLVNGLKSVK